MSDLHYLTIGGHRITFGGHRLLVPAPASRPDAEAKAEPTPDTPPAPGRDAP